MPINFNVNPVVNNKINKNSQEPLSVSKMGINELVDTPCDLLEEANLDKIKYDRISSTTYRLGVIYVYIQ